jgi:hypothetical protein
MRGTLRWVHAESGGRRQPFAGTRYAVTAYAETGEPSEHWSIVIDSITPGVEEREVEARWLVWPNVDFVTTPGTILNVCEGRRVAAHLDVRSVEFEDV